MRSQSFLRNSKSSSSGLFACCLASSTSICKTNSEKKKKKSKLHYGQEVTSDHNKQKNDINRVNVLFLSSIKWDSILHQCLRMEWLIFNIRKLHAEMVLNLDWKAHFCDLQYRHKWVDYEEDWWLLSKTSYSISAWESGNFGLYVHRNH